VGRQTRSDAVKILQKLMLAGLVLIGSSPVAFADSPNDLLVVANNGVGAQSADASEIRAVFLKSRTALGGATVFPLNAKTDSELRAAFRARVLKMTEEKERGYWDDEKIRKGTEPPAEVPATLKAVFSKASAISYVFRKDYKDGTAKILAAFPE
jgi:hypothetical protein